MKKIISIDNDLKDLAEPYFERKKQEIIELRKLCETNDLKSVSQIAHKMKGVAASYGFDHLSDLGAVLDVAAKSGNQAETRKAIEAIATHLSHIELQFI